MTVSPTTRRQYIAAREAYRKILLDPNSTTQQRLRAEQRYKKARKTHQEAVQGAARSRL